MTLQELKDIATIVSACVGVFGLVGLYLTWFSIRGVREWNRLNAAFTFFPNPLDLDVLEGDLDKSLGFWRSSAPLEVHMVQALFGDIDLSEYAKYQQNSGAGPESIDQCRERMLEIGRKLKLYLNLIETYCAAVNAGVADERAAKHIFKTKFIHHRAKLTHFVPYIRDIKGSVTVLSEFTTVAKRWEAESKFLKLY